MWLKLIAMIMLVAALRNRPYGYYVALRWLVFVVSLRSVADAWGVRSTWWAVCFAAMAIVFNPFFPFRLERDTWHLVDIAAAGLTAISIPFVDLADPVPEEDNESL